MNINFANNLTEGLGEIHPDTPFQVKSFIESYVGSDENPIPFGGREEIINDLTNWLDNDSSIRNKAIITNAGRGKSALLANWVVKITKTHKDIFIIYFPISARFNTNLESVVFGGLVGRFAKFFKEELRIVPNLDGNRLKEIFISYLHREFPEEKKVLIVLDGLDESAGWEVGANLLPTKPNQKLRIIISARKLVGDQNSEAWLDRLGWEGKDHADLIDLDLMEEDSIKDVLNKMGDPLATLAADFDMVKQLHILSEGEPLLIRMYIESLLEKRDDFASLSPNDLLDLEPGFAPFFEKWIKDQNNIWKTKYTHQDDPQRALENDILVRHLFRILAFAKGPLMIDDIFGISNGGFKDRDEIRNTINFINRFVVGDGIHSGFFFSHPKLCYFFEDQMTPQEIAEYKSLFLNYCSYSFQNLIKRSYPSQNVPRYVVKYYSAHLDDNVIENQMYYDLLCKEWLNAWESIDGTPSDFLSDVQKAWDKAIEEGPQKLDIQIFASLWFSSFCTLQENIPNELIIASVEKKVISYNLGLLYINNKSNKKERLLGIINIFNSIPIEIQSSWEEIAINLWKSLESIYQKGSLFTQLLTIIDEDDIEIIGQLKNEIRKLPDSSIPEKFYHNDLTHNEVLIQIKEQDFRIISLSSLIEKLTPGSLSPSETSEIEKIITKQEKDTRKIEAQISFINHIPENRRKKRIEAIYNELKITDDTYSILKSFKQIIPFLSENKRKEKVEEIYKTSISADSFELYLEMFSEILNKIYELSVDNDKEYYKKILLDILQKSQNNETTKALVLPFMSNFSYEELKAIWGSFYRISDRTEQLISLFSFYPHLSEPHKRDFIENLLEEVTSFETKELVITTEFLLCNEIEDLDEEFLQSVFTSINSIKNKNDRYSYIRRLAPFLKEINYPYKNLFVIINQMEHSFSAMLALIEIYEFLPIEKKDKIEREIFDYLSRTDSISNRAEIIFIFLSKYENLIKIETKNKLLKYLNKKENDIEDGYETMLAKMYSIPFLKDEARKEAMILASQQSGKIEHIYQKLYIVILLLPYLQNNEICILFDTYYHSIWDGEIFTVLDVESLQNSLKYFNKSQIYKSYCQVIKLTNKSDRASFLIILIKYLEKQYKKDAFKHLYECNPIIFSTTNSEIFTEAWNEMCSEINLDKFEEITSIMRTICNFPRGNNFHILTILSEILSAETNETTIINICRNIKQIYNLFQ